MNYLLNNSTGARYEFDSVPQNQLSAMLDYSSPIEYMGKKGYYVKGDPFTAVLSDGTKLNLGVDEAATRKRQAEDLALAEKRQKIQENDLDMMGKKMMLAQSFGPNAGSPKLEKGERWNPDMQRVESVPGSDRFIKQSGQHANDAAALAAVDLKTKAASQKVDEIVGKGGPENPSDAFKMNFGGYNAYLTRYAPGETTDVRNKIEGLKSDLKSAGLELMRQGGSIGMMTEREWPIVEQMIANINPSQSEQEAAFQLAKVKTYMQNIARNAQDKYKSEWGNTQFYKDGSAPSNGAPQVGEVRDGYKFLGGNPGDKSRWLKVQ